MPPGDRPSPPGSDGACQHGPVPHDDDLPAAAPTPPSGPDEVRDALVAAAGRLYAERGPARVSVREVAAAAQVNHGLVHRYVGSKDDLLGAVLDQLADAMAAEIAATGEDPPRFAPGTAGDRYLRVLAHALLDGSAPEQHQSSFPLVEGIVRLARSRRDLPEREARLAAARIATQQLGWRLFGPFALRAAGLDEADGADVARLVDHDTADLIGPDGADA